MNQKRGDNSSGKRPPGKQPTKSKPIKAARKKTSLPSFGFADDLLKSDPAAPPEPASPEPASPEPASPEPASPEPTGQKINLPAFGFAEDLLKDLKRQQAAADSKPAFESSPAAPLDPSTPLDTGAARIFSFADQLEAGIEEQEIKPVRLETWLTFGLAGETYALPVKPVHEVVRPTSITRVPHAPQPIRGVTNLRGRVVPVIDLRRRLQLQEEEITRGSRVVVVGSRGRRIGLLVDLVHHVMHLDMDRVQPPPDDVMTSQSDYISGVYHMPDGLILLLDVDRILIVKESVLVP